MSILFSQCLFSETGDPTTLSYLWNRQNLLFVCVWTVGWVWDYRVYVINELKGGLLHRDIPSKPSYFSTKLLHLRVIFVRHILLCRVRLNTRECITKGKKVVKESRRDWSSLGQYSGGSACQERTSWVVVPTKCRCAPTDYGQRESTIRSPPVLSKSKNEWKYKGHGSSRTVYFSQVICKDLMTHLLIRSFIRVGKTSSEMDNYVDLNRYLRPIFLEFYHFCNTSTYRQRGEGRDPQSDPNEKKKKYR